MVSDQGYKVNGKYEGWTQALKLQNPYSSLPCDVTLYVEDSDLCDKVKFCFIA